MQITPVHSPTDNFPAPDNRVTATSSIRLAARTTDLYFPTLDGLRFFAFLLVFIHHLPDAPLGSTLRLIGDQGWVGVHLFLFISAYLLSAILSTEREVAGRISVINFYMRRGLRIWPLYFGYVVALFALSIVIWGQTPPNWLRLASLMIFVDNIVSGFQGYNPIPYTAHLWTIALEEQFYLVLPLLLAPLLKSRNRLLWGIFVCWLAFVGVRILAASTNFPHPGIWTSVFSADSLLLGTLLGVIRPAAPNSKPLRFLLPLSGAVLLLFGAWTPDIDKNGPHQVFLYSLVAAGAAMVTMSVLNEPYFKFLATRPLRYLGKISYGLYVFHLLGIGIGVRLGSKLIPESWFFAAAMAFVITLGVSAISYRFFEKYCLRFKRKFEVVHTRPI